MGPTGPLCYLSLNCGQSNLDLVSSWHVKTEKEEGDRGTTIAVKKKIRVLKLSCSDWNIFSHQNQDANDVISFINKLLKKRKFWLWKNINYIF